MNNRDLPPDTINESLYLEQQNHFRDLILHGNNSSCFIVEDFEASWGKSTFALNTLPQYKEKNPCKRVLWIVERIDQCTKNVEDITKLFNNNENIAGAIVGGMSSQTREEYLNNYDIIFITSERYRRLSRLYNTEERKLYTENRHLLIIDEKLEMYKEITFSLTKDALLQNEIDKLGGDKAVQLYNQIVEKLLVVLKSSSKQGIIKTRFMCSFKQDVSYIDCLIQEFENLMYSKVENKSIFYQDYEDNNYQTILEKVEDLREFYVGQSIMYYDKKANEIVMSVPNYSMKMWTLENNLILDATASIDKSYSYNTNLFKVAYEDKIFNHYRWMLEWADVNSTTHGRNNVYINYTDTFNSLVEELGENDTIVFAKKYDDIRPISPNSPIFEKINKFKGAVTHKGVINSSNEFLEKKNAINSDSNYDDEKSYVLKYLYCSRLPLQDWHRDRNGFTNLALEEFKIYEMARGLYQFFKRPNRNMQFDSRLILLTHKKQVADIITSMFNGIIYKESTEIKDLFVKKNPEKSELFIELCNELLEQKIPIKIQETLEIDVFSKYKDKVFNGQIPKKVFAKALDMTATSFGNNVLNKTEKDGTNKIKNFLTENNIEVKCHSINFKFN